MLLRLWQGISVQASQCSRAAVPCKMLAAISQVVCGAGKACKPSSQGTYAHGVTAALAVHSCAQPACPLWRWHLLHSVRTAHPMGTKSMVILLSCCGFNMA